MEVIKISVQYKQNKKQELLRTCQSIVDQTILEPGCLQSSIKEVSETEQTLLLIQQWQSWAELSSYLNSDQFSALLGAMKLFGRSYDIQLKGRKDEIFISA